MSDEEDQPKRNGPPDPRRYLGDAIMELAHSNSRLSRRVDSLAQEQRGASDRINGRIDRLGDKVDRVAEKLGGVSESTAAAGNKLDQISDGLDEISQQTKAPSRAEVDAEKARMEADEKPIAKRAIYSALAEAAVKHWFTGVILAIVAAIGALAHKIANLWK